MIYIYIHVHVSRKNVEHERILIFHFLGPEVETGWHSGNDYSSGQVSTKKMHTNLHATAHTCLHFTTVCRSSRPVSLVF